MRAGPLVEGLATLLESLNPDMPYGPGLVAEGKDELYGR